MKLLKLRPDIREKKKNLDKCRPKVKLKKEKNKGSMENNTGRDILNELKKEEIKKQEENRGKRKHLLNLMAFNLLTEGFED